MEARSEAAILGIMMLQEAALTFGIHLPWPQSILDVFSWVSSIFNFSIAFSGPECLGGGGYSARWATNAMAPVVLIVLHGIVFCIRHCLAGGDEEKKARVFSQGLGSFVLWMKIISMMMLQLAFNNLMCSTPKNSPNIAIDASVYDHDAARLQSSPNGGSFYMDADPSIVCPAFTTYYINNFTTYSITMLVGVVVALFFGGVGAIAAEGEDLVAPILSCPGIIAFLVGLIGLMVTTPYGALLGGSIIIFLIFFVGFVGGSAFAIRNGDCDYDSEFRVLLPPPADALPLTANRPLHLLPPLF